jgi:hypothetical protein
MNKVLKTLTYTLNPAENGGESLILKTEFFDNGDHAKGLPNGIYTNQTLTLQSYGNSASLHLCGTQLTSEILRDLANKLDQAKIEAGNL